MDQSGCRNEIMHMHEKRFQSLSNPPIINHNEQCSVTDSQSRDKINSHCGCGSTVHRVGIGGADHPAPKFGE